MEGQLHLDPTHFGHAKTSAGTTRLVDNQVDSVTTTLIGRPYVKVIASSTLPSMIWESKQPVLLDPPTPTSTALCVADVTNATDSTVDLVNSSHFIHNRSDLSKHDALDLTLRRSDPSSSATSTTSNFKDGNSLVINDCDMPMDVGALRGVNVSKHESYQQQQQQQQRNYDIPATVSSLQLASAPKYPSLQQKQQQQQQQQQQQHSQQLQAKRDLVVRGGSSGTVESNIGTVESNISTVGNSEAEEVHRCDICAKTFAVPARLTRHYRTHTGERPFICDICGKSFSVKENLSVHRRIHTKEKPYRCPHCDRGFEHSGKLHRHMRIHTGERPHQCSDCGKTFIQSGQLVIHMRSHTGEKPYVCSVCTKGFTCSKQLKVHSRTHTGERPYVCDVCGKNFAYNHVLKLHQMAHLGERLYKCTLCSETYSSKKMLETHIKSHAASSSSSCTSQLSPKFFSSHPSTSRNPSLIINSTEQSLKAHANNQSSADGLLEQRKLSQQQSPSSSSSSPLPSPSSHSGSTTRKLTPATVIVDGICSNTRSSPSSMDSRSSSPLSAEVAAASSLPVVSLPLAHDSVDIVAVAGPGPGPAPAPAPAPAPGSGPGSGAYIPCPTSSTPNLLGRTHLQDPQVICTPNRSNWSASTANPMEHQQHPYQLLDAQTLKQRPKHADYNFALPQLLIPGHQRANFMNNPKSVRQYGKETPQQSGCYPMTYLRPIPQLIPVSAGASTTFNSNMCRSKVTAPELLENNTALHLTSTADCPPVKGPPRKSFRFRYSEDMDVSEMGGPSDQLLQCPPAVMNMGSSYSSSNSLPRLVENPVVHATKADESRSTSVICFAHRPSSSTTPSTK